MTEPISEQERRKINETLARAQGWTDIRWHSVNAENPTVSAQYFEGADFAVGTNPMGDHFVPLPDFTRDPAARDELVRWLASQSELVRLDFLTSLLRRLKINYSVRRPTLAFALLTADPLTIAKAAREAIGGKNAIR